MEDGGISLFLRDRKYQADADRATCTDRGHDVERIQRPGYLFFFFVFVSVLKGIQSHPLRDGKRDGEVGILKRQCIRIVG